VKDQDLSPRFRWMVPILLLAFMLRMTRLGAQSIWYDEAFYATVSSVELHSLLDVILDIRVQPPAYFLIMHCWLALGHGEFVIRALSGFAGLLGVAAIYLLGTIIVDRKLGVAAALALAISPFHIWYSQEVKMYSLIAFLVAMSCYFFLRLIKRGKARDWLGYGLSTLFAIYTHYLTIFVIVAQMTYLVLARRRYRPVLNKWLVCMTLVGSLYVPWIAAVFLRGGFYGASISWISAARPADLFWTIYDFGFGSTLNSTHALSVAAGVLLASILAYVSVRLLRPGGSSKQRDRLLFVSIWLFVPLLLVFLISFDWPLPQKRSIYMDRYLILLLPAFLILVCHGTMTILRTRRRLGTLVALGLIIPASISTYSIFFDGRYQRDQWRQAIGEISQNAGSHDILLVRPQQKVVFNYYGLDDIEWVEVPYFDSREEYDDFLDAHISPLLDKRARLWTLVVSENANPHRFVEGNVGRLAEKVQTDQVRGWLLRHYDLLDDRTYVGVYLGCYGSSERAARPPDKPRSLVLLTGESRSPYTGA
jgi:mannosyltransferase